MGQWIVLLVVFKALFGFSGVVYGRELTLQEAIHYAIEHSPELDSAKRTQMIRGFERKNAFARFLPSFDLTTTQGLQDQSSRLLGTTAPWYSQFSLGLTETLYDNGESITRSGISKLNEELAQVSYLKTRDNLALSIALEYYRYSLAQILTEVRKQQRSIIEEQFKLLSNQYRQGLKTKQDFLRFKAQLQRSESDVITSVNTIGRSKTELKRLLGVKLEGLEPEPLDFQAISPKEPKQEFAIPKEPPSLESTYDSQISKIQTIINDKTVYLVQRKYWPQLSVTSALTYLNRNYIDPNPLAPVTNQTSWNVLFTLTYNIWDWGTRNRDVSVAEQNREIQQNTLNQGLLLIRAQIENLMLDFIRSGSNHVVNRELLLSEQESYDYLERQYREGKVNYLDLITSLNNLLDAKVRFYTTYFDLLSNFAQYRYFERNLYETLGL